MLRTSVRHSGRLSNSRQTLGDSLVTGTILQRFPESWEPKPAPEAAGVGSKLSFRVAPVRMNASARAIYRICVGLEGPAQARWLVSRELSGLVTAGRLDELKLMVSELVTNGIVYGAGSGDDTITLELRANPVVHCEVVDHGSGFTVPDDLDANRGWGLKLVDRLADRWGVSRSPEGTHVWFESTAG